MRRLHETDPTDVAKSATPRVVTTADPPDIEFVDLRDHPDDALLELIHAKGGLYERSFPVDEEREHLDDHRRALWGDRPKKAPILHFIVAKTPGESRDVLGFVAAEYYGASRCGLLSYIAVDEGRRRGREKVGRRLVGKAVEALHTDADGAGVALEAIFGEIHDPAKAKGHHDSMKPLDRVRVMDALGARRVPIPYVQPPLDEHGHRARTLMLVAFPIDGQPVEKLEPTVVRSFVTELYEALEVPQLLKDVDFVRSLDALRGDNLELSELRSKERPTFVDANDEGMTATGAEGAIEQYGIAIHLVLEPEHELSSGRWKVWRRLRKPAVAPKSGANSQQRADPLRSFEEDILAYADSDPAPFRTFARDVPDDWALVSLTFPAEVVFSSEGRLVPLRCDGLDEEAGGSNGEAGRTRRFLLRASQTTFDRSKLSVLHLVFGPDPGDPTASVLNEYDLIKLMKLWQPGEGLTRAGTDATPIVEHASAGRVDQPHQFLTFHAGKGMDRIDGTVPADEALKRLATEVLGLGSESPRSVDITGPRAGTVQLLHSCCELVGGRRGPNICGQIDEVLKGEGAVEPPARLAALGGLVCGLLDFTAIDGDELADVFRELTHDDQSVRSCHKGTLLVASGFDRAFDAEGIRASVGVSPYLLIPQAVLLHNEWWLAHAVEQMDKARGLCGFRKLERAREDVAKTLAQRLVSNVFNYRDERSLYDSGLNARSLNDREHAVRERLNELTNKLHARHEAIRGFIGAALALIALVFTLGEAYDKHSLIFFIVIAAVTIALLIVILFAFSSEHDNAVADG